MGQYYCIANLDKKEWISSYDFGGLGKLMEFASPRYPDIVLSALAILLANGNGRGGGDLQSENTIVGSWSGNRISVEGDYADPNPEFSETENIYTLKAGPEWINVSIPVFMAMLDDGYNGARVGNSILQNNNYREFRSVPDVLTILALAHEDNRYPLLKILCEKAFLKIYKEKNKDYYHAINGIRKYQTIYNEKLDYWEKEIFKYIHGKGLTLTEIRQIDFLQNKVHILMSTLLNDSALEWNMEWIGELSDAVTEVAVKYFGANEKEFYPHVERLI